MAANFNSALILKTSPDLPGLDINIFCSTQWICIEKLYLKPIFVFNNNLNPLKWPELKEFYCESSRTAKDAFIIVTPLPKYMCAVIFFLGSDLFCYCSRLFVQ